MNIQCATANRTDAEAALVEFHTGRGYELPGLSIVGVGSSAVVQRGEKSRPSGTSFDPQFARDTVLPLVQAAYQVFHNPDVDPTLPAGYQKTALLEADPTLLDLITELSESARSFVQTVAGVTTVFGVVGKNTATKTAFVAIRGTQSQTEWLQIPDSTRQAIGRYPIWKTSTWGGWDSTRRCRPIWRRISRPPARAATN